MSHILFIDNDKMVAAGLAGLLSKKNRVKIAHNMNEMKDFLALHVFDMAVLDMRMEDTEPDIHFLDVLLEKAFPVLLLTGQATQEEVAEYIRKGAQGIIRKMEAPSTLRQSVAAVLAGQSWIPQEINEITREAAVKRMLTRREQDILDYFFLPEVPQNSQIANAENISLNTARNYVSALMLACGAKSRHLIKSRARLLGYASSGRKIMVKE